FGLPLQVCGAEPSVCGIRTRRGSRRRGLIDCTGRWRPETALYGTTIKRRSKLHAHKVGIELPRAGLAEHDEFVIAVAAHVPEHWSRRDAQVAASSWVRGRSGRRHGDVPPHHGESGALDRGDVRAREAERSARTVRTRVT